ncbi:MAG: PocR ligand-binding domain-containing protein [Lachnospiraceae bacterium]|nr:PocR ligand-binding domain-containing protein [Lachnospiraceae bacterium]
MDIRDFVDLEELESMQIAWSQATGLASIFTDAEGNYITGDQNFTDFCIKFTRGTSEGLRRCVDCDQNGLCKAGVEQGSYLCHAGLMDFAYPIKIHATGEVVMTAIGGQALPSDMDVDEAKFRKLANEIGVDENKYIEALHKVPTMPREKIEACADLLGLVIDSYVNQKYNEYIENKKMTVFSADLEKINGVIDRIEDNSKKLTKIASKQGILALNSAIEAARLGTAGASFSILAKQESDLSKQSGEIYAQIGDDITIISEAVNEMNYASEHNGETAPEVSLEELL